MKKTNLIVLAVLIIAAGLIYFSYGNKANNSQIINNETENNNTNWQIEEEIEKITNLPNGEFTLSSELSKINWEGSRPAILNYKNNGTLNVKSGSFSITDNKITAGQIIIDMESLKVTQATKSESMAMLERHLKSDDFFGVDSFPESTINLVDFTKTESFDTDTATNLVIDLVIKDISQEVSIPAEVYQQGDNIVIKGQAELDRTLWNIRYGSDKFFDNLADNAISDNFTVDFEFIAPISN